MDMFQRNGRECFDIFDIPYYNALKKYMRFVGIDPHQGDTTRSIIVTIMVISITSLLIPSAFELYVALCAKDVNGVLECLPQLGASGTSVIVVLNVHFNRKNFDEMYKLVARHWELQKSRNELHVLEEITMQGSKMARYYRNTLLLFLVGFVTVPLIFPVLDVVLPLNETRPRQQIVRVNYLIFDVNEYFFSSYLHLSWSAIALVVAIVTVDSLYILIIHHTSGLFAVCGYEVQKVTNQQNSLANEAISENHANQQLRSCVITHSRAIQFYNIVNESSQFSYLIQVGLNMLGISATAVQTVVNLDKPEQAIRNAMFHGADQFHLFMLCLPGQILLDNCFELARNIYCSTWYKTPTRNQKILYMMQIRSAKPSALTAGGLYEMNMENFGITFRTCMSYFTMMMSLND